MMIKQRSRKDETSPKSRRRPSRHRNPPTSSKTLICLGYSSVTVVLSFACLNFKAVSLPLCISPIRSNEVNTRKAAHVPHHLVAAPVFLRLNIPLLTLHGDYSCMYKWKGHAQSRFGGLLQSTPYITPHKSLVLINAICFFHNRWSDLSIRVSKLDIAIFSMSKSEVQSLVRLIRSILYIILTLLHRHLAPNLFPSLIYLYVIDLGKQEKQDAQQAQSQQYVVAVVILGGIA